MLKFQEIGSALRRASDVTFVSFLCIRATPETVLGDIHVGPIPLPYFLYFVGLALELSHVLVTHADIFRSKSFIILSLVYGLSLTNGLYLDNAIRFIAIDSVIVSSIYYGLLWAMSRSNSAIVSVARNRITVCVAILGTATFVGMATGLIAPESESARLYTYSEFDAIFMLCALCPVCSLANDTNSYRKLLTFAPLFLAIILAYTTASRTGTACCIVAFIALSTLMFSGLTRAALAWCAIAGLILTLFFWGELSHQSVLFNRVSSTSFSEEGRYTEIFMMLDDLRGSELTGRGLGSRFATNIDFASPYALAPHVGFLAILHKAGYPIFVLVVVLPVFIVGWTAGLSLFKPNWIYNPNRERISFVWGVVICSVHMSLSPGWDVLYLGFTTILSCGAMQSLKRKQAFNPRVLGKRAVKKNLKS